ncbi:MAG: PAS domain-containing protein [Pseudomonadota bacterium]
MFCDAPISMNTIAEVFDHSKDCVKLLSAEGRLLWMNAGGLTAMELDDFASVKDADWSSFWPTESQDLVRRSYDNRPAAPTHFTAFCPTALGSKRWWDVSVVPLDDFDGSLFGFLATSRDVTERVVRSRSREALLQEMRHRQGNTLSLASTLMVLHSRDRPEVSAFVEEMSGRLAALGRAQSVVGNQETDADVDIDLLNLLEVLVRPLVGPDCELNLDIEPGTYLDADNLDAVGMVLSELAVNSAKHGAFNHGGRLALSVSYTNDGVEFTWQERCDRAVAQTRREGGQGQTLMHRIATIHDGTFEVEWRPRGQLARLTLSHRANEGDVTGPAVSSDHGGIIHAA